MDSASASRIKSVLQLPGEIKLNEDQTARCSSPRQASSTAFVCPSGKAVHRVQCSRPSQALVRRNNRSELPDRPAAPGTGESDLRTEKSLWERRISAQQDFLQADQQMHEAEVAVANAQQSSAHWG